MMTPEQISQLHPSIQARVAGEQQSARGLVVALVQAGYNLSVYDGEEWAIRFSVDVDAVCDELGACDEETLRVRRADRTTIGDIYLVWGNSPEELVSNYSDVPELNAIIPAAMGWEA